ncbi:MAG: DUF86 domain-containing protein [Planctomycetota bacterium]
MRSDHERLLDIQEAIERVEKYAAKGRAAFERDELIQTWIVHHLLIIGEACRAISDELKQKHAGVPWAQITGMRNILVHQYFGIDTDAVWQVVEKDLTGLKQRIDEIVDSA